MADIITTLHRKGNPSDNVYPNVKEENIPDTIQRKLTQGSGINITSDNVISANFDTTTIQSQLGNPLVYNYFDSANAVVGYISNEGELVSTSGFYTDTNSYKSTALANGLTLRVYDFLNKRFKNFRINYYSESYSFVRSVYSTTSVTIDSSIAPYFTCSAQVSTATALYQTMLTPLNPPLQFYDYNAIVSIQSQITSLNERIDNFSSSPLSKATFLNSGDSVAYGALLTEDNGGIVDGKRMNYMAWVAQWYGGTEVNLGHSGGCIAVASDSKYHLMENNQYVTAFSAYSGQEVYLTLMWGFNDSSSISSGAETLGEIVDSPTTSTEFDDTSYIGAYQHLLTYLLTDTTYDYSKFHILVLIPPIRNDMQSLLRQLCIYYRIGFFAFGDWRTNGLYNNKSVLYSPYTSMAIDGTTSSPHFISLGSVSSDILTYQSRYTFDGVHPNAFGHKKLGKRLIPYLLEC